MLSDRISKNINYHPLTIESITTKYDIVVASEIIEHVPNSTKFLEDCVNNLNDNGILVISSINKTLKSLAAAIVGAEYVLRLVPPKTHDFKKFVDPYDLQHTLLKSNCFSSSKNAKPIYCFMKCFR